MYIERPKKLPLSYQMIIGCVFSLILGTLFHFLYDWTNGNFIASLFSPVNESPWEHLKTVFWAMAVFLIIQLIYLKSKIALTANLIWYTSLSIVLAMVIITVTFYTYVGVVGFNINWLNIGVFFLSVCAAYLFNYKMLRSHPKPIPFSGLAGLAVLSALAILLISFTFYPPNIGWFSQL